MPKKYVEFQKTWQKHHPVSSGMLWSIDFILEKFPYLRNAFNKCEDPRQISDIARAHILYEYGGLYVDCDFECLRPLNPLMGQSFIGSEDGINLSNGLIYAATKRNLFLKRIISAMENFNPKAEATDSTGPRLYTRVLQQAPHSIKVYPPEFFYPVHWNEDRKLLEGPFPDFSDAVHHWK